MVRYCVSLEYLDGSPKENIYVQAETELDAVIKVLTWIDMSDGRESNRCNVISIEVLYMHMEIEI